MENGGLSDILGMLTSNPDMLGKIMDMLPLITQMVKSADSTQKITPAPAAREVLKAEPIREQNPNLSANNMSVDNIAAMVSSVLSSLKIGENGATPAFASASAPVENPSPESNVEPNSELSFDKPAENADATQSSPPKSDIPNFDIEKTLGVLKNVTSETSPEKDNRVKLLLALKPFMKNGRQQKIDMAIKYLNAAKVFNMFGKSGFI